jgi:hypothetical protein
VDYHSVKAADAYAGREGNVRDSRSDAVLAAPNGGRLGPSEGRPPFNLCSRRNRAQCMPSESK